jgi:hypothetical protein
MFPASKGAGTSLVTGLQGANVLNRNKRGIVSAYVLLTLGIMLTVSLGVGSLALQSIKRVRRDRDSVIAEQAAFATLEMETGKAYNQLSNSGGKLVSTSEDLSSSVNGVAPGVVAKAWITPTSNQTAYITADATYKGMTRSVRYLVQAREVSMWNNAIFAGSGAAGQAINGNVDIRGSVHILGDGEPYLDMNGDGSWNSGESFTDKNHNGKWDPGEPYTDANGDGAYTAAEPFNDVNSNGIYDPPMTQTSMDSSLGGTAYIGNNYFGLLSSVISMVPLLPSISGQASLNAEVRVKHGQIALNGNAKIGSDNFLDGGLSKATIDGSFVNDGYVGNQGASHVFSDNGTTNGYDLNNIKI